MEPILPNSPVRGWSILTTLENFGQRERPQPTLIPPSLLLLRRIARAENACELTLRIICRGITFVRTVRPPRRQSVHLGRQHCGDGLCCGGGPDGRHRICRCWQGWRAPLR